ncbi:MAG: DUF2480 family protein [Bernardetiaceae bacterium]|nr:DUF2480 family protein [Bernardetiaceae bacterium]
MEKEQGIINKVAQSSVQTIDLEELYPQGERILYDIKDNLFEGIILKEKDFRAFVKGHNWADYAGKHVAICCSVDAIVPTWAYMVLAAELQNYAKTIVFGDLATLETRIYQDFFESWDAEAYRQAKVVIKGCSKREVPIAVYVEITRRLAPIAKLISFGEACSSVPVYKNKSTGKLK